MKKTPSLPSQAALTVSRRTLVQGSTLLLGSALGGAGLAPFSDAATDASFDSFMQASGLLIQHRLNPVVGRRLFDALQKADPAFKDSVPKIIQIAQDKQAKTVEDFFPAITDATVKAVAEKIIFAWYAGVLDASPEAEVLAFETALMYQTTKDAMTIPSFVFSGPNNWADINPPLEAMPEF